MRRSLILIILFIYSCGEADKATVPNESVPETLPEPLVYLHRDSCLKYNSDSLYALALLHDRPGMENLGYLGDSGRFFFNNVYSEILNDYLRNDYPDYQNIYEELNYHFQAINDLFSCVAGGGTLYSRMEGEISGHINEIMLIGLRHDFKSDFKFSEEKWKNEIMEIIELSYGGNPDETLKKCYLPFTFKDSPHKGWIQMQVYFYMSEYNFGP